MNDTSPRKIKTGGDPRTLPDYSALRDELGKLTHPARPDVNWQYVEKLCLSLFEQNGVELQTAAWYTLARAQLAGLFGLNEGLTIIEALVRHQWGVVWPQPVHARMEILSSLSHRLQQRMRSLPLNYSDLSQLYRAEQLLTGLGEVLQRLELKHLSQLDTLRTQMHMSAVRLENSDGTACTAPDTEPDTVLPATVMKEATAASKEPAGCRSDDAQGRAVKWIYVAQSEPQPNVDVLAAAPVRVNRWTFFAAGMCAMLMICMAAGWGWHSLNRSEPLKVRFAASLAPLPSPLAPEDLERLRRQSPLPQSLLTQTEQQLARLDRLPPDWSIAYSRILTEQAQALWPEQGKSLADQWQQNLNAAVLSPEQRNVWDQGMTTLKNLSNRLNGLDQQKGKYITVSELKSIVFTAMHSFHKSIPAEEQLRVLSQQPAGAPLPAAARTQLEMHLKQLTASYAEIKQNAAE